MGECRVVDGSEEGRWISDGLKRGPGPTVREQIPELFHSYLRLFHPAVTPDGQPVSWRQVAREMGKTFHARAQWNALSESNGRSGRRHSWAGMPPPLGELDIQPLDVLCSILSGYTHTPDSCYFGLSTIFSRNATSIPPRHLLRAGGIREYVILAGPLTAAGELEVPAEHADSNTEEDDSVASLLPPQGFTQPGPEGHAPVPAELRRRSAVSLEFLHGGSGQAPNLIWPFDRSWFVVSEVDFDSTLVGGSEALVQALASDERLETQFIDLDSSLAADADPINAVADHEA